MAQVLDLSGKPADIAEVDYNRSLVESLEELIADVKRGKVIGVGLVTVCQDGDIDTNFEGRRLSLLAGASRLVHHLNMVADAYAVRGKSGQPLYD